MTFFNCYTQGVTKKTIIEHFSNTRCSVCASRNPGFYSAKKEKPKVLHIAYHPSSPYSSCLFSTQNKVENDERANYYNLYGGTPTFAINGDVKSSSDVQNAAIYNGYETQTSPLSIDIKISPSGSDSIGVRVEIKAVNIHSLKDLLLYVALIEDTVFYNAPNGEKQHYDVFRKSFSGTNSKTISAPFFNGNPYIYTANIAKNQLWNLKRLSALAILSTPDKSVIQVEQSALFSNILSSQSDELLNKPFPLTLFPNPSLNTLNTRVDKSMIGSIYNIYNALGLTMKSGLISQEVMDIEIFDLPSGKYIIKIGNNTGFVLKSFLKI